jgi:hypothetical protein
MFVKIGKTWFPRFIVRMVFNRIYGKTDPMNSKLKNALIPVLFKKETIKA